MATKLLFSATLTSILVLQHGDARAVPTEEQKCAGRKHVAAGQYAMCRQAAQKKLVLTGNQTKYGIKVGKCAVNFTTAWNKAEEKAVLAGATCPDEPLAPETVQGAVAQLAGNLAGALGGASLLSCTVTSPVLATEMFGCHPRDPFSGQPGPCPGTPLGQDGELAKGVPHSYTDNGDTITDDQTGLMWEKLAWDGSIHDHNNLYDWYDAMDVKIAGLNSISFAGHNDWRLPNINELETLREVRLNGSNDIFRSIGCIPGCTLPNCSCDSQSYWSSTSYPFGTNRAWDFYMAIGYTNELGKSVTIGVRAVRAGGGPSQPLRTGATLCDSGTGSLGACPGSPAGQDAELALGAPHSYTDNLDGTITDNSTGLMWESLSDDGSIHDVHTTYVWSAAFDKVAQLNTAAFAGHMDWRLPNLNEMRSLVHYRYANLDPVFNAGCTPGCTQLTCNCAGTYFWTSSPQNQLNGGAEEAWVVFNYGLIYPYYLTVPIPARAVRDAF